MIDKVKQGKKNRINGQRFELAVRKEFESKRWIVCKWSNNIDLKYNIVKIDTFTQDVEKKIIGTALNSVPGKLIPAKRKFNPFNKALSLGTGFPDFIAFRPDQIQLNFAGRKDLGIEPRTEFRNRTINGKQFYEVIGVEAKSNGYLNKEEKEKCKWLLDNQIFSKILIASKGNKRGEIIYNEFE